MKPSSSSSSKRRHSLATRTASPDKVLRVALKPSVSHGSTSKKDKVFKLSAAKLPLLWHGDEAILSNGRIAVRKKTPRVDDSNAATSNEAEKVVDDDPRDANRKERTLSLEKSESIQSLDSGSVEVFQKDATEGAGKESKAEERGDDSDDDESIHLEVISSDESDSGKAKIQVLKRDKKVQNLNFQSSTQFHEDHDDDDDDDENSVSTRERKDTIHMPLGRDLWGDGGQDDSMSEADYYRSPTMLSRLIQFQKYDEALLYLEDHPAEASIWMVARRKKAMSPLRSRRMRDKKRLNQEGRSLVESESDGKRKVHSYSSSSTTSSAVSATLTLRQLPLHIACQQFSLVQQHDPNNLMPVLEELLTQLLVVCPQACRLPDHNGMYCIHYLVQYRASPELINIALMTFPEGANKKDPIGRSLKDIFHSTSPLRSEDAMEESDRYLSFRDRAKVRKEDAILELLEYDHSFWEMALQETSMVRNMQQTWKKEKDVKPTKASKNLKFKGPWELAKEREDQIRNFDDTERTADESLTQTTWDDSAMFSSGLASSAMLSSGFISSEMIGSGLISYESGVLEEEDMGEEDYEGSVPATAWTMLEQRALMLEKLLLESTEQNYDLQKQLRAASSKHEASRSSQVAEMAKEAFELRRENASLSNELNVMKKRLASQQEQGQTNKQGRQKRESISAAPAASSEVSSATTLRDSVGSNLDEDSSYDFSDSSGLDVLKRKEGLATKSSLPSEVDSPVAEVEIKVAETADDSGEEAPPNESNVSKQYREDSRESVSTDDYKILVEKYRVQNETVQRLEATVDALLGRNPSREQSRDTALSERQRMVTETVGAVPKAKVASSLSRDSKSVDEIVESGSAESSEESLATTLKKVQVARDEIEENITKDHDAIDEEDEN